MKSVKRMTVFLILLILAFVSSAAGDGIEDSMVNYTGIVDKGALGIGAEKTYEEYYTVAGSVEMGHQEFIYSDSMLLGDEDTLSTDLMKASAILSSAAYFPDQINAYLEEMGYRPTRYLFDDQQPRSLYDNDYAAVTVGQKDIDELNTTIFCIAVRGTLGGKSDNHIYEWFSNFNIGRGNEHEGFYTAAEHIRNAIQEQLAGGKMNVVLWFTGHSRGAAVANVLAGLYSKGIYRVTGHTCRVYGYTYACPAVSINADSSLQNIYNINNEGDLVPMVPLSSWHYKRFGQDRPASFASEAVFTEQFQLNGESKYQAPASSITYKIILSTMVPEKSLYYVDIYYCGLNAVAAMLTGYDLGDVSTWRMLLEYCNHYDQTHPNEKLEHPAIGLISRAVAQMGGGSRGIIKSIQDLYSTYANRCDRNDTALAKLRQIRQDNFDATPDDFNAYLLEHEEDVEYINSELDHNQLTDASSDFEAIENELISKMDPGRAFQRVMSFVVDIATGADFDAIMQHGHNHAAYIQYVNSVLYGYRGRVGSSVTTEDIPDNITTIGPECFANRRDLESVILPDGLVKIGESAFDTCIQLTEIELPETLQEIPDYCFNSCTALQHVYPLDNLKRIEKGAFYECRSLEGLELPDGLEKIGDMAFRNCISLTSFNVPESVTTIETSQIDFWYNNDQIQVMTAIMGCAGLKKIELYAPLDYTRQFFGRIWLSGEPYVEIEELILGEQVKSVFLEDFSVDSILVRKLRMYCPPDENTYSGLSRIKKDIVELHLADIPMYYPSSQYATPYRSVPGDWPVLETLSLGEDCPELSNVFNDCPELKTVRLPEGVDVRYSFRNCPKLTTLTMPEESGITFTDSFSNCGFTGMVIPSCVSISGCFEDCPELQSLEIGAGIIKEKPGLGSPKLASIRFGKGTQLADGFIVTYLTSDQPENADEWVDLEIVTESEGQTTVPEAMFCYPNLRKVTLPDSVTVIEEGAFHHTARLQEVRGLGNVETVKEGAFFGCGSFRTHDFSGKLKEIRDCAFAGCESLENMPEMTELEIRKGAFMGCKKLMSITGLSELTRIEDDTFNGCESLTDIDTGDRLFQIGKYAFAGCKSLETLGTAEKISNVEAGAFAGCTSLKKLPVSLQNVSWIGGGAFAGCAGVEEIVLPESYSLTLDSADYELAEGTYLYRRQIDGVTRSCFENDVNVSRIILNTDLYSASAGSLTTNSRCLSEIILNASVPQDFANLFFAGWGQEPDENGLRVPRGIRVTVSSGETALESGAFEGLDGFVTEILLDESYTKIGSRAFAGNNSLRYVRMGAGIADIAEDALAGCENVTVLLTAANVYVTGWCADHGVACRLMSGENKLTMRLANGYEEFGFTPEGWTREEGGDLTRQYDWLEEVVLPMPEKEGQCFSGWYLISSDSDTRWNDTVMPHTDITLYASWNRGTYRLTLLPGDGTLTGCSEFAIFPGTRFDAYAYKPFLAGSLFTGWYTDEEKEKLFDGWMPERDVNLYAEYRSLTDCMNFETREDGLWLKTYTAAPAEILVLPAQIGELALTGICEGAFEDRQIRQLVLPAGLSHAEGRELGRIIGLETIETDNGNPAFTTADGILYNKDLTALLLCPNGREAPVVLPESIRTVKAEAFRGSKAAHVTFNDGLAVIEEKAFMNAMISAAELPDSVTTVGDEAFAGSGLASVVTGSGLVQIGTDAFECAAEKILMYGPDEECAASAYAENYDHPYNMYILTWMNPREAYSNKGDVYKTELVKAGQRIDTHTCNYLDDTLYFQGTYYENNLDGPPILDNVMPARNLVMFPYTGIRYCVQIIQNGTESSVRIIFWQRWDKNDLVIPAEYHGMPVTEIDSGCFEFAPSSQFSVQLPDSIVSIPEDAFAAGSCPTIYCTSEAVAALMSTYGWNVVLLTDLPDPVSIQPVNRRLFLTPPLNRVQLAVTADEAYLGEEGLQWIIRGTGIVTIDDRNVVTALGAGTATLELPAKAGIAGASIEITVTADNAILFIPDGTETIETEAFYGVAETKAVVIPESVSSIGSQAFAYMQNLEVVVLPSTVSIAQDAFEGSDPFIICEKNSSGYRLLETQDKLDKWEEKTE